MRLLTTMLHLHPQTRITPSDALIQPLLTRSKLDVYDDIIISIVDKHLNRHFTGWIEKVDRSFFCSFFIQNNIIMTSCYPHECLSSDGVTTCVTSIHTDEESKNDISPLAIVTWVDGASAATELSNRTCRYSGVGCVHIKGRDSDTDSVWSNHRCYLWFRWSWWSFSRHYFLISGTSENKLYGFTCSTLFISPCNQMLPKLCTSD